jgi:hypothetical protein
LIPSGRENAGGARGLHIGEDEDEIMRRAKGKTVARTAYVATATNDVDRQF